MPFENFYRPEKFSMFTDILNDYRNQKKMAADRAFEEKKQEELQRQFNANFGLKEAEEKRAQQKFPFDLQQMKDTHSTSMMNNMINQKAMQRAEATLPYILQQYQDTHKGKVSDQGLADVKNEVYRLAYQHEVDLANQRNQQQEISKYEDIQKNEPGNFLTQGESQQFAQQQTPPSNMNQQVPQNQSIGQNTPELNQQMKNMTPSNEPTAQQNNEVIGKEIVINEGDPATSYKNIESKPSEKLQNGHLIRTWANGKVTATKMPAGMADNQKVMSLEDKLKLEDYKSKLRLNEQGTEFDKKMSAEDAKNLGQLNNNLYVAREIQPSIDYIRSLANTSEMQSIKRNPLLFGKDITYFKKAGTKEEQRIIGKMISTQKEMLTQMAQKFKGAFRKGEQELLKELLPSDSDTLEVMMGKIQGTDMLNQSVIQRLSMVDDLVRDRSKKTTINHAMEEADKKFPISEIEKLVKSQYETNESNKVYSSDPNIQKHAIDAINRGAKEEDVIAQISKMGGK